MQSAKNSKLAILLSLMSWIHGRPVYESHGGGIGKLFQLTGMVQRGGDKRFPLTGKLFLPTGMVQRGGDKRFPLTSKLFPLSGKLFPLTSKLFHW